MLRGKDHPLYKRIERRCKTCNKPIFVIPARLDSQKFCSMACYFSCYKTRTITKETRKKLSDIHKKSGHKPPVMVGSENPMWKGGMPKCPDCGLKLGDRHSKTCRSCFLKTYKGDKTPNWKGGFSDKDHIERGKFRNHIQMKVFERDNFTCQLCGIRGVNLQVDHIQSWSEYIELRFCIDNCRTLCASCHYHITFGKPMPPTVRAWGHNLFKGGTES